MTHWSHAFLGQRYIPQVNDCASFATKVQREVFGRDISLPMERACGLRGQSKQLVDLKDDYGIRTDQPKEGDAVLMMGRGRLSHVGIYCEINNEGWVLHAMRGPNQVVLHRLRDLPAQGLTVENFYQWL
jgi:hypothetical protein